MRIVIKVDKDNCADGTSIVLSDEQLNNDNFIDLVTDIETYTISIDDFATAIKAFEEIRERNHQHDIRHKE